MHVVLSYANDIAEKKMKGRKESEKRRKLGRRTFFRKNLHVCNSSSGTTNFLLASAQKLWSQLTG